MPEPVHEVLTVTQINSLLNEWDKHGDIEVLIAGYLAKKMSKELPPTGNPPALQEAVDDSKRAEWDTLKEKNAIRFHFGKDAQRIREKYPDRFIGGRHVITRKPLEENGHVNPEDPNTFRVKSRWCLQGHLDPDLDQKIEDGLLQSPTLSQMGRNLLMQIIANNRWILQLGDIKGAFLESGPISEKFRPLFAKQPMGSVPGLPSDAVIEVTGNVYGQNDAPVMWYRTFDQEVISLGWSRSKFDSCLYYLRSNTGELTGIMGVHVDDTAIAGCGTLFQESVAKLKARSPYRKWRVSSGEFCGAFYEQDKDSFAISMSMQTFADTLKCAHIPKGVLNSQPLNESQIKILRAINGSLNWLASQSRPDISCQTSMSQQAFPNPCIRNLRDANNAVRRAKQHKQLKIVFQSIPIKDLTIVCHSDAAWANVGTHTQAGYIIAFTDKCLHDAKEAPWVPVVWKSYRLARAVSSTLAGESQAMSVASGTVEWLSLMMSEAIDGPFQLRQARAILSRRRPLLATDCKSLYDHLVSPSSPTAIDDRRTSIDVVIIRESLKDLQGIIRWLPTDRMIADGLTKDKLDPADLLRSCVRSGVYQIAPETTVLARQAAERELRKERQKNNQGSQKVERSHKWVLFLYSSFCLWNTWPTMGMISRNQLWIDAKLFPWRQRSLSFTFSMSRPACFMYSSEQTQVRTSDHKVFLHVCFCDSCCIIHNTSSERQHLEKFLRSNSHFFSTLRLWISELFFCGSVIITCAKCRGRSKTLKSSTRLCPRPRNVEFYRICLRVSTWFRMTHLPANSLWLAVPVSLWQMQPKGALLWKSMIFSDPMFPRVRTACVLDMAIARARPVWSFPPLTTVLTVMSRSSCH